MFVALASFCLSLQYNYFHSHVFLLHMQLLGSFSSPSNIPLEFFLLLMESSLLRELWDARTGMELYRGMSVGMHSR